MGPGAINPVKAVYKAFFNSGLTHVEGIDLGGPVTYDCESQPTLTPAELL